MKFAKKSRMRLVVIKSCGSAPYFHPVAESTKCTSSQKYRFIEIITTAWKILEMSLRNFEAVPTEVE